MKKSTKAAKLLGKLGGETKSAAKANASRLNGTKGGRPRKRAEKLIEIPPILGPTLELINQLEREGIIKQPTIGGSVAIMYYAQPVKTDDLDIFCCMPNRGLLLDLQPIYKRLEDLGCKVRDLYINIRGVDVQFLVPANQPLVEEALENAASVTIEKVTTHIFEYEYALAVKAEAGRPKDWAHIATALESAEPDKSKLDAILTKYGLMEKWRRKIEE
jgi:predicted nucleotidyltransferase